MPTAPLPVSLTPAQIEEFGRELDAIRDEVMESRGENDRRYILRLIKTQRSMALGGRVLIYAALFLLPAWGHALAGWGSCLVLMGLATLLEPLLIVAMGLIVMLIVLAVLLPIIEMNQLVK